MILSQGRKIVQRQRIVAAKYCRTINGGSQHVAPVCSISSSTTATTASSPSLPLSFSIDDRDRRFRSSPLSDFKHRNFSAASEKKDESSPDAEESLKDTVRRMQRENKKGGGDDATDERVNDFMRKASDFWSTATEEVSSTWEELKQSGERKSINKTIGRPMDTVDGDAEYTGPVSIMVIDESENLTAWERMQKRLTDAPVIQGKYFYSQIRGEQELSKPKLTKRDDNRCKIKTITLTISLLTFFSTIMCHRCFGAFRTSVRTIRS
jgi:hypothetical protein